MKNFFSLIIVAGIFAVGAVFVPLVTLTLLIGFMLVWYIAYRPIRGVVLAAFFLPFERLGSFELFGLTVRFSQIVMILTFFVWLTRGLWKKEIHIPRNPLFWFVVAFLLANFLSLINAVNLTRSSIVFLYTAFTLSLVILLPLIITSKPALEKVIRGLLWGYVIVSIFGIYQFAADMAGLPPSFTGLRSIYTKDILGFTRVQSTALEPLYFANYLIIPLSLILVFFLRKIGWWKSDALVALFVLGMTNFILTASRGGYIAFGIVAFIILLWHGRKLLTPKNLALFLVAVLLVAGSVFTFLSGAFNDFIGHTVRVFQGASYEERRQTIDLAWQTFWDHPLLGVGIGGFGPLASRHPFEKPADGWKIVNNETLEVLVETGIFGFLTFSLLILALLFHSWFAFRQNRDPLLQALLFALVVAFIGILIQYQTFSVLYIMHVWFTVGLIVAMWNIMKLNSREEKI